MGVAVWAMSELEADNGLASAAEIASRDSGVEKICIWTPDKDLAQCVRGDRIVQVDRRNKTVRNAAGVRAKFGVDPELIPDYLALVGDSADGFPGIAGIGAKGDAISEARRRFGNPSRHFETTRDVSLARWLNELIQDSRFAFRQMRKNAGFTAVAILVIGLGIGSVTTIFSLVNAVLLRPLPYGDPSRLVYLWTPNPRFGGNAPRELAPNYPDFYDWQRMSHSFSSMSMVRQRSLNLDSDGKVARTGCAFVTGEFFETLDVRPQLGRAIEPTDDMPGRSNVAVISDRLWRTRFESAPAVIGKRLTLNRDEYTIVGVMPKPFGYPFDGDIPYVAPGFGQTDVWAPLAIAAGAKTDRINFNAADAAVARLRPAFLRRKRRLNWKQWEAIGPSL